MDLCIDLLQIIILLRGNRWSSLFKSVNDPSVFVSKWNLSDLNWIMLSFFLSKSEIVHCIDSLFQLVLNIEFELSILAHWVLGIIIISQESFFISIFFQIKAHGVISSCNGVNIKLNKLVHLDAPNIIQVNQHVEIEENSDATDEETIQLSVLFEFWWD